MSGNREELDREEMAGQAVSPGTDGSDSLSSEIALPHAMLEALFNGAKRGGFGARRQCIIIGVPSESWAEPIARAASKMALWGDVVVATKKSTREGTRAIGVLAAGRTVLCVSQSPERFLPRPLMAVADLRVTLPAPDSSVLRKVISLATAKTCPAVPTGLGVGLDFLTIAGAIRRGSTPRQCIERLIAAQRSARPEDPALLSVPLLEDLAGYGAAMTWCRRLAADIELWRKGLLAFEDIQRTAVFHSAPGLGKTSLVRSLARTTGPPLFASSVGTWFSQSNGYLDGVIKEIDLLFASAAREGPAIVFLDEIEALPRRSDLHGKDASWWTPVVGHMLTTLDGANSGGTSKLVIIGATNHADRIDEALLRRGRLAPVIRIERPNRQDLGAIFRQHLGSDLPDVDLDAIAAMAGGASGADVAGWVKGARAAARGRADTMQLQDIADQIAPRSTWTATSCAVSPCTRQVTPFLPKACRSARSPP